MTKKTYFYLATAVLVLSLAACSAAKAATSGSSSSNTGSNTSINATAAAVTLENRLAPGILLLEGTTQAVTAGQAKQLLPLWQQIQTLDNSGTAASTDYQPIYQQIEAVLNSDQTAAIVAMSMNQSDLQTLMTTYGISITPGTGGFGGGPTLSADQRSTFAAQRTLTPGAPGRGFSGTPGANSGRGFAGTGTPGANGQFRGNRNMNTIFVNALIQLLQQRGG